MALFDFLFGDNKKAAEQAAAANRAQLAGYGADIGRLYGAYEPRAIGELGTGLERSTGALQSNLQAAIDAYTRGGEAATGYGQQAVAAYDPVAALGGDYGRAVSSYYDALGLGGPEGVARAKAQFTTSPGYQFAVDEATRAAKNTAASLGIAGSGNTLDEIRRRAQGFAGQEYGSYLDRLAGFVPYQLSAATTAAGGRAGGYRTLADLERGTGRDIAAAYGQVGPQLSNLYTGYGRDVTDVYGNVLSGRTQAARDVTTGGIQANNLVASAAAQDAANKWNFLGSLVGGVGTAIGGPKPR